MSQYCTSAMTPKRSSGRDGRCAALDLASQLPTPTPAPTPEYQPTGDAECVPQPGDVNGHPVKHWGEHSLTDDDECCQDRRKTAAECVAAVRAECPECNGVQFGHRAISGMEDGNVVSGDELKSDCWGKRESTGREGELSEGGSWGFHCILPTGDDEATPAPETLSPTTIAAPETMAREAGHRGATPGLRTAGPTLAP